MNAFTLSLVSWSSSRPHHRVPYLYLKIKSSTWLECFKKYSISNPTVGVEKWDHMQWWSLSFHKNIMTWPWTPLSSPKKIGCDTRVKEEYINEPRLHLNESNSKNKMTKKDLKNWKSLSISTRRTFFKSSWLSMFYLEQFYIEWFPKKFSVIHVSEDSCWSVRIVFVEHNFTLWETLAHFIKTNRERFTKHWLKTTLCIPCELNTVERYLY